MPSHRPINSLQAVSTFSDSEQAMSIAPIFLPPLAPGRYLPPSGYAPDELALARQLSLQGIVAPDKGLGLGRGAHQKSGLGEGDNQQPMRHRDKVHGLRRELQARRRELVADKVMRHRTYPLYQHHTNTHALSSQCQHLSVNISDLIHNTLH